MTDPFDIYNNTGADIVCAKGTVPANSYISVLAADAPAWAKDPIVISNMWNSLLGVMVYGTDYTSGFGSQADVWLAKISEGVVVY